MPCHTDLVAVKSLECPQIRDRFGKPLSDYARRRSGLLAHLDRRQWLIFLGRRESGGNGVWHEVAVVVDIISVDPCGEALLTVDEPAELSLQARDDQITHAFVFWVRVRIRLDVQFVDDQPSLVRQILHGMIALRRSGDPLELPANQADDMLEEGEGPVQRLSQSAGDALSATVSAAQQFLGSDSRARRPGIRSGVHCAMLNHSYDRSRHRDNYRRSSASQYDGSLGST
ncbi:hypothetical protein CH72_645 [Burkholderia ambifaria AMMD]|uniref:Uncharacterized protein n=1 Tax=Burkholderia ambifaria (strain ATCC BAA-244 / DSM 16087 / CCUG 44356 / LMG 19182 / AMMD) TaxID=339670 RepID=Q0BHB2_BURCM|nr:hypothetical protein Bamb_0902 [Burkholderia ambifaria AMMD]AJY22701.1 hypothetical protein CH72_645 [Burkholderia ambifaria AMMD]